jgi:quercetin dioxygenase-like cupin family protein
MLVFSDSVELYKPFQLFTPEQCENIIHKASEYTSGTRSLVEGRAETLQRTSTTFWFNPTDFSPDDLMSYFSPFAEEGYPVTYVQRPLQVVRYMKGELFGWHYDQRVGKHRHGRVLTLTCTLREAPGAELEIKDHSVKLKTGDAVVFPANVLHRATAPIEGERWALTTWASGTFTKISKRRKL